MPAAKGKPMMAAKGKDNKLKGKDDGKGLGKDQDFTQGLANVTEAKAPDLNADTGGTKQIEAVAKTETKQGTATYDVSEDNVTVNLNELS
jgi:hypothetical protein